MAQIAERMTQDKTWFEKTDKDRKKEKAKENRKLKKKLKRCGGLLVDKRRKLGLTTEYSKTQLILSKRKGFMSWRNQLPLKKREESLLGELLREWERMRKANVPREGGATLLPLTAEPPRGLKLTNGIEIPEGLKALIASIEDVATANVLVKLARKRLNKLKAQAESEMCKQFAPGMDVWWTKKKAVMAGKVVKVRSRKLVIRLDEQGKQTVTLPVKKVRAGTVPVDVVTNVYMLGKGGERQAVAVGGSNMMAEA
jgi:hypothetical protein